MKTSPKKDASDICLKKSSHKHQRTKSPIVFILHLLAPKYLNYNVPLKTRPKQAIAIQTLDLKASRVSIQDSKPNLSQL